MASIEFIKAYSFNIHISKNIIRGGKVICAQCAQYTPGEDVKGCFYHFLSSNNFEYMTLI